MLEGWERGCDDACDEISAWDVWEAGAVADPGLILGVVGDAWEAAAVFVEIVAVLPAGNLDVGCAELCVTPVDKGTLFCRLWRAISMWFVAVDRGSNVTSSRVRSRVRYDGDIA